MGVVTLGYQVPFLLGRDPSPSAITHPAFPMYMLH